MLEVYLYKVRAGWAIKAGECETYPTIELAADVLMTLGIKDEAIDDALIEMYGNAHSRATFSATGALVSTDEAKLDVPIGSA